MSVNQRGIKETIIFLIGELRWVFRDLWDEFSPLEFGIFCIGCGLIANLGETSRIYGIGVFLIGILFVLFDLKNKNKMRRKELVDSFLQGVVSGVIILSIYYFTIHYLYAIVAFLASL